MPPLQTSYFMPPMQQYQYIQRPPLHAANFMPQEPKIQAPLKKKYMLATTKIEKKYECLGDDGDDDNITAVTGNCTDSGYEPPAISPKSNHTNAGFDPPTFFPKNNCTSAGFELPTFFPTSTGTYSGFEPATVSQPFLNLYLSRTVSYRPGMFIYN